MKGTKGIKGLVVSAPSSSSGKTVFTLALMEALRKRGFIVQPFKAGPDYIDPSFHRAVCRRPSYNLDTWMMGEDGVRNTFLQQSSSADIPVIEGVMGLFDGKDGAGEEGSTAHLAKVLGAPVVLVVNAEKAARSVGALIKGFEEFDRDVDLRWVVFNRVGSPAHIEMLKASIPRGSNVRVLGAIPRDASLSIPSRHLGLVLQGELERREWRGFLRNASRVVEKNIDIEALLKGLRVNPGRRNRTLKSSLCAGPAEKGRPGDCAARRPARARIAVALDAAFSFYYEENLDILRTAGAELVFFSPVSDKSLPPGVKGLYLGGGYPEANAKALEANKCMREEIRVFSEEGMPVYAECGGLMYLCNEISSLDGSVHSMAGVFPWRARMLPRRKALGYREVRALEGCPFLKKGSVARGHEFHYSELSTPAGKIHGLKRVFEKTAGGVGGVGGACGKDRSKSLEGYLYKNTLATYVHLHFSSNRSFAGGFIEACSLARPWPGRA